MNRLKILIIPALAITLLAYGTAHAGVELSRQEVSGKSVYVMENEYLRLAINPGSGGRAESLFYKPAAQKLSVAVGQSQAPAGSGLFIDRFRQFRDFEGLPYEAEVVKSASDYAALRLTCTSHGLRIEKTIEMRSGVSSVKVSYQITNEGNTDFAGSFWVVNSIVPEGAKSVSFYYPYSAYSTGPPAVDAKVEKPVQMGYTIGMPPVSANNWMASPARAWGAVVGDDKTGAAFNVDYSLLDLFYSYHPQPGQNEPIPTFEWMYMPAKIPPIAQGRADAINHPELSDPLQSYIYRTSWSVMPFHGLDNVSGAESGIVCSVVPSENRVKVSLVSDAARIIHVSTSMCRLPEKDKTVTLASKDMAVTADKVVDLDIPVVYPGKGTYVLMVNIDAGKNAGRIASFEVPYTNASPSADYVLKPEGEKSKLYVPNAAAAKIGTNIPEPCIEWAKPLMKAVKVILITPADAHSESAEFLRRADIDLSLIEVVFPHVWKDTANVYWSWQVPDPTEALKEALAKNPDVIVIGGSLWWQVMPADLRDAVMKKVEAGTGLVYVNPQKTEGSLARVLNSKPSDSGFITKGIPSEAVPGLEGFKPFSSCAKAYTYGKGRIVTLLYNPTPHSTIWRCVHSLTAAVDDDTDIDYPYWEYYYSLLSKATLFAAQREPDVRIAGMDVAKDSGLLKLALTNRTSHKLDVNIALDVRNRRWEASYAHSSACTLTTGENSISIPVEGEKMALSGLYFYNVQVKSGYVQDFGTASISQDGSATISKIELTKPSYNPGEAVTGRITLRVSSSKPAGAYTLQCKITDANGRLIAESTRPISPGIDAIVFRENMVVPPLSTGCKADFELLYQGKAIDYCRKFFTVCHETERDLLFTVWGSVTNASDTSRVQERMREIGFGWSIGALAHSVPEEIRGLAVKTLSAGLECLPMTLCPIRTPNLKGTVRNPCLTDPVYLARVYDDIKYAEEWEAYLPPAYFIGDENSLGLYGATHDFCQSPTCLAAFRESLQQKYGDIKNLNAAWKTVFENWDNVVPYTWAEAESKENFAPWAEHRLFMFSVLGGACAHEKASLTDAVKNSCIALSGQGKSNIYNGVDWSKLSEYFDFKLAYASTLETSQFDIIRSFKSPGSMTGLWSGYAAGKDYIRSLTWQEVMSGFFYPGYWCSMLMVTHGDCNLSKDGLEMQQIIAEVKDSGIGKALMESEWMPSQVAIHYSIPSLVASKVTGRTSFLGENVYSKNLDGWSSIIRDMGFQPPQYLSSEDLENGRLTKEKYRVFILPLSQALSDKEVDNIVKYVKSGGILIADSRPGIMHENSLERAENSLFNVFGVKYGQDNPQSDGAPISYRGGKPYLSATPVEKRLMLTTGLASGTSTGTAETIPVDLGGISISSGSSGATVLSFITNKYGEGTAIYLNCALSEYQVTRAGGTVARPMVLALKDILAGAGFTGMPDADLPLGTEVVRYTDGSTRYICVRRELDATKEETKAAINLGAGKHVYDMIDHKYLGRQKTINTTLEPGCIKVFALTDEKRGPVNIKAGRDEQGAIKYSISLPQSATGIVRLEVSKESVLQKCYTRNLKVKGGLTGTVPLGLNERNGIWKLAAIDVVTGARAEANISFK